MSLLLPFCNRDSLWGYIDHQGNERIKPEYQYADRFYEDLAVVRDQNYSQIVIDIDGRTLFSLGDAKTYHDYSSGLLSIEKDNKQGYLDRDGKLAIPHVFDHAADFRGDVAAAEVDKKWGIIDRTGHWVLSPCFSHIFNWNDSEEFTAARIQGDQWVIIDRRGKVCSRSSYIDADPQFGNYITVRHSANVYGLLDEELNEIWRMELEFLDSRVVSDTISAASKDGLWGVLDLHQKWIVPPTYADLGHLSNGRRQVYVGGSRNLDYELSNGKFGFLDQEHRIAIEPQFDEAEHFRGNFAKVSLNASKSQPLGDEIEKWGYIDVDGKYLWKSFD